jgi:shikimate dehydrogenase
VTRAWPVGTTRLVALLGWPARYSRSPAMHNAAFRALGLDLVYVVLPCAPADMPGVVAALRAVDAVGANVTVPHKSAAFDLCDRVTDEAALVGAVNTLMVDDGALVGDNTDAAGLRAAWQDELGLDRIGSVTVLGTGGAARAVAVATGRIGARLTVVGRRADAAASLAALADRAGAARAVGVAVTSPAASRAVEQASVVVNATPLGTRGESLPEPFMQLDPTQIAYDLVYAPLDTPFLRAADARGASAHNGLGMLLHQAALAFRLWTGQQAPLAVMREVLDADQGQPDSSSTND